MKHLILAGLLAGFTALPAQANSLAAGDTLECRGDGGLIVQVVIGKIDINLKAGEFIVSASLFNDAPGVAIPEAGHLPFDLDALKGCKPVAARPLSANFAEGYGMWREAFDKKQGGYFTISPPEAYQFLLTQVPQ
jgi:hypothetical protein